MPRDVERSARIQPEARREMQCDCLCDSPAAVIAGRNLQLLGCTLQHCCPHTKTIGNRPGT